MLALIDPMDPGPRKRAAATERLCVATRRVKPITDMIRFVVGPDGQVVADLKRKLPGRGVWVTATRQALAEAIRRKTLARAFKREVRVEPDLADRVEALLERSALDALAIARKAGALATGFAKVEAALQRASVVALIHAADAGPDGLAKIAAAARRRTGPATAFLRAVAASNASGPAFRRIDTAPRDRRRCQQGPGDPSCRNGSRVGFIGADCLENLWIQASRSGLGLE